MTHQLELVALLILLSLKVVSVGSLLLEVVEMPEEIILAVSHEHVQQYLANALKLSRRTIIVDCLHENLHRLDGHEVRGVLVVLVSNDCSNECVPGVLIDIKVE